MLLLTVIIVKWSIISRASRKKMSLKRQPRENLIKRILDSLYYLLESIPGSIWVTFWLSKRLNSTKQRLRLGAGLEDWWRGPIDESREWDFQDPRWPGTGSRDSITSQASAGHQKSSWTTRPSHRTSNSSCRRKWVVKLVWAETLSAFRSTANSLINSSNQVLVLGSLNRVEQEDACEQNKNTAEIPWKNEKWKKVETQRELCF